MFNKQLFILTLFIGVLLIYLFTPTPKIVVITGNNKLLRNKERELCGF